MHYRRLFLADRLVELMDAIVDLVVEQSTNAIFDCRVEGLPHSTSTWYKDGRQLLPTHNTHMSVLGKWHGLEIQNVTASDHGLYAIVCSNNATWMLSEANLYVTPTRAIHHHDGVLYIPTRPRGALRVIEHLRNVRVQTGEPVSLKVQFENPSENYMWFKSNSLLHSDSHYVINEEEKACSLFIERARACDSGVYMIVTKTKHGYATSFANVHVTDIDPKTFMNYDAKLPRIEEPLPEEWVVYEREEAKLTCKVALDHDTEVKWLKNGKLIENSDERIVQDNCCNRCINLKISHTSVTDQAEYTLTLQDPKTGRSDSCACTLIVKAAPNFENKECVYFRKPMESAIACFGSQVSFQCGFGLDNDWLVYAVWYVGHHRIVRTNAKFDVVCKDGQYLLTVKQVEPGMSGEVVCELRHAIPSQPSVVLASCAATLTVVPLKVLEEEIHSQHRLTVSSLFREFNYSHHLTIRKMRPNSGSQADFHCPLVKHFDGHFAANPDRDDVILEVDYCRLEEPDYYILHLDGTGRDEPLLAVYRKPTAIDYVSTRDEPTYIILQWEEDMQRMWYKIELIQPNGQYVQAGLSTVAKFEVKNPPVGKWLNFRVKVLPPADVSIETNICIVPISDTSAKPMKQHSLKSIDEFEEMFSKIKISDESDVIGRGGYAEVVLVQDQIGTYYAAKILKTKLQKHRDNALREYETMKQLQHPKLVELNEAFISKQKFVFVMEYLWGGELFDRIVEEDYIDETDVISYVRQILEGLEYLHARNIIHLDLKPENIVCCSPNSRQVKIIDFGLARILDNGRSKQRAIYGTKEYIAPEVINYDELTLASDMWSLGVVTYVLLSGVFPFVGDGWPERSVNINMVNYDYCDSVFKEVSDLAKDFIDGLLLKRPDKRMTATEALAHRWVLDDPPWGAKARHMKRAIANLKTYLASYKVRLQWQKATNIMIATQRLRNQAKRDT